MRCVVLCRTDMNNDRFCTIVRNKGGENLRLLTRAGNPTYTSFFGASQALRGQWVPGRVVEVWFDRLNTGVRPTHPEDSIKSSKTIQVTNTELSMDRLHALVVGQAFDDVEDCFPDMLFANSKGYVLAGTAVRHSVGYLSVQRVTIQKDTYEDKIKWRAWIVDDAGTNFQVPIKDVQLLEQIEAGQVVHGQTFHPRLIFVGLSNPFKVSEEQRAYLQLLHTLL